MAQTTGIEWCDATFNPWWGCEKVSPACAHCYADTLSRRYANGVQLWGTGHEFRFFGDKHWAEPLKWARLLPAKLGRRPRVFCASMADVFEERDELDEHRERLFDLIEATPELDWLLLTKRPEFARDWLYAHEPYMQTTPLPFITRDELPWGLPANVWMGVSIENARFTWRADVLREIPAAVRFISAEPLLGSLYDGRSDAGLERTDSGGQAGWVDGELGHEDSVRVPVLQGRDPRGGRDVARHREDRGDAVRARARSASDSLAAEPEVPVGYANVQRRAPLDLAGIDWVIAGGESGPRARPSHPDWFRELRQNCVERRGWQPTAFFFKQWGEWAPGDDENVRSGEWHGTGAFVDACLCSEGTVRMVRTGKRTNGRLLDGREWDEFPASVAVPA